MASSGDGRDERGVEDGSGLFKARVIEKNGELSCSIEETDRLRKLLGMKPLRLSSDVKTATNGSDMTGNGIVRANVMEKDGEVSCSVEETNRIRKLLGMKPLNFSVEDKGDDFVHAKVTENNGEISCSVEETNRIRVQLGLKPLNQGQQKEQDAEMAMVEEEGREVRARIAHAKKQRKLKGKLYGKTLGDESGKDVLSAAEWAMSLKAEKKSDDAEESQRKEKKKKKKKEKKIDLEGLRVAHEADELVETGKPVVLTLKDSSILNEETGDVASDEDELENIRLSSTKRVKERHEKLQKRKRKANLSGIEDNEEKGNGVLSHYDQVIEEESRNNNTKRRKKNGSSMKAIMTSDGTLKDVQPKKKSLDEALADKLQDAKDEGGSGFTMFKQMQDYYAPGEMDVDKESAKKKKKSKNKAKDKERSKPKKKRFEHLRRVFNDKKEEDEEEGKELEVVVKRRENTEPKRGRVDSFDDEDDSDRLERELELPNTSFAKPRNDEAIAKSIKEMRKNSMEESDDQRVDQKELVVSSTTTFTSAIVGRAEEAAALSLNKEKEKEQKAQVTSMEVDNRGEEELPKQGSSLSAALQHLKKRGDLNRRNINNAIFVGRSTDEKPIVDDGIGPRVEYRDEHGRLLTQKEAFRQFNYDFHGIKPSLKSQDRRRRDLERQRRMLEASREVGVAAMRKHQQETGEAFVKLSES